MKNPWPIKKLGEVTEIYSGGTPRRANPDYWGNDVPWLTMEDVNKGLEVVGTAQYISNNGLKNSNAQLIPAGSVNLSCTASVGNVTISRIPLATNQQFNSFHPKEGTNLISEYLAYRLMFDKAKIKALGGSTTFQFISKNAISNFEIPIPPESVQKQIVERIDKIAEAQKLNDELLQKSDELFQSLLHQELDAASRDWELKKLGEICEKIIQAHPSKFFKRSFHYIDISSINSKSKTVEAFSTCSIDQAPSRARKLVQKNDILFATTRPYLENIAIVPDTCEDFVASTGFCVIRANTEYTTHDFLFFNVISRPFIRKILPFQRGANYPAVSDKNVYGIKIPLPPLETQKQIVEKLSAAQEYKKQLLEQKLKLKELFNSVLHKSIE